MFKYWVNNIKLSVLIKLNAIVIKIPMLFFHRNSKNNPKNYMKLQKTPYSKSNLEQEETLSHHTT
jgi:hypothetical protein